MSTSRPPSRLAVISSQAFSIHNFRGPLIRELVARGVRVFALAPDYDEASREAVSSLGATPVDFSLARAGMNPLRDLVDAVRLSRLLRRLEPDLTFSYFIKPVIYGTLAATWAAVPRRFALVPGLGYVFTFEQESGSPRRRLLRAMVARLYAAAFARSERVIFQNDEDAEWFMQRGLLAVEKTLRVSGTGVDLSQWKPAPARTSPVTFILVARLLREKGILDFIAAARRVKERHPHAKFVLVGGVDPNPGSLAAPQVAAWVAEGLIEWPGQVSDVRPWLDKASVFVLPSFREGKPRSTQEAMAMGRPVITTDAVGCRETVVDGINGFLVPVQDPAALATAMERFLEQPTLIESMGSESRRLAEERFDVRGPNAAILRAMGFGEPNSPASSR